MSSVILSTQFPDLKLFKQGKVRDVYDLDNYYLIVSTDRLSAFDVIMQQGIPHKGNMLTIISEFWFDFTRDIIENHVVTTDVDKFPEVCLKYKDILKGRSMLVKKAELIPIECIVRGYITGTGWQDYLKSGSICGIELPKGLQESQKLDEPIFTPSSKAEIGDHDENISYQKAIQLIGESNFEKIKDSAIKIYKKASEYALSRGIIIADTKMEFGFYDGKIILIDELLTPDSSRFWDLAKYKVGTTPESFDKQFVRDYLTSINFDKKPPAPILPDEIIYNTQQKYTEALVKFTLMSQNEANKNKCK